MNKLNIEKSKKEKENKQIEESKKEEEELQIKYSIRLLIIEKDEKSKIKKGKKLLLTSDLSTIESIIKTWKPLKDIKKLLVLKHTLKGSKVDTVALAILSAVISGVLPLLITNGLSPALMDFLLKISNVWCALLIGLIIISGYVGAAYWVIRTMLHMKFLDNVRLDVIVDLIDMEIEKIKKVPVKKTNTEKKHQ